MLIKTQTTNLTLIFHPVTNFSSGITQVISERCLYSDYWIWKFTSQVALRNPHFWAVKTIMKIKIMMELCKPTNFQFIKWHLWCMWSFISDGSKFKLEQSANDTIPCHGCSGRVCCYFSCNISHKNHWPTAETGGSVSPCFRCIQG